MNALWQVPKRADLSVRVEITATECDVKDVVLNSWKPALGVPVTFWCLLEFFSILTAYFWSYLKEKQFAGVVPVSTTHLYHKFWSCARRDSAILCVAVKSLLLKPPSANWFERLHAFFVHVTLHHRRVRFHRLQWWARWSKVAFPWQKRAMSNLRGNQLVSNSNSSNSSLVTHSHGSQVLSRLLRALWLVYFWFYTLDHARFRLCSAEK